MRPVVCGGGSGGLFVDDWGHHPDRGVASGGVVPVVDPGCDSVPGLLSGCEGVSAGELGLQRGEERLGQGRWTALSTAPDSDGDQRTVRVTHPFHPWLGREFPFVGVRRTWGESRVLRAHAPSATGRSHVPTPTSGLGRRWSAPPAPPGRSGPVSPSSPETSHRSPTPGPPQRSTYQNYGRSPPRPV